MNNEITLARKILNGSEIGVLDAVRLVKNILDTKVSGTNLSDLQYCAKVIYAGLRNARQKNMQVGMAFSLYLEKKRHLRADSLREILYLGNRLFRAKPENKLRNFSDFSVSYCEEWLDSAFSTPSQFKKARTMLHGFFEFAVRREWCDRNPVKLIERKKIVEQEIIPLKFAETRRLIDTARKENTNCAVVAAVLAYSGIRPCEVRRLCWNDIDFEENIITVRSICSKTGGVRQVEIVPALRQVLKECRFYANDKKICPSGWEYRWRKIRNNAGFRGKWVQDVLRHTYASFHVKRYADMPRLQLNMGHRDLSLLRSRYVNMRGISKSDAMAFFR